MNNQPVGQPLPLRLDDAELIALGAFIRGQDQPPREDQAKAVATIGVKLTGFFMHVAKVAVEHYDRAAAGRCGECWACIDAEGKTPMGYVLCPLCGNKRCPHASDHELECTKSNEPGQPGAPRYGGEPR